MKFSLRRSIKPGWLLLAALPVFAFLGSAVSARAEAGPKFETDYKVALARSAKEHKPVMMDVYTDWCGWCKKLDAEVYSRPDVAKRINTQFVFLKINPEKNAANKAFVGKFKVDGYPTVVFLNAKGQEIHRQVGYQEAPDFLKTLTTAKSKSAHA